MSHLEVQEALSNFIVGAKKIGILGVGNDLRTDDGLGLYVIEGLKHLGSSRVMVENVGSVPEAFAHPLAQFGAERVIMVDAADMMKPVGHIELVTKERIGGVALSTHRMPLSLLMQYLEDQTGGRTILIGVQPKSIQFGEGLTPEIEQVAQKIISTLETLVKTHFGGNSDGKDD
ncbi:MAG: hydrogenase maturation peptidase HycI [Candidatus Hodarchaeota archaeon]